MSAPDEPRGPRYPKRRQGARPRMTIDNQDLGRAMTPSDVYIEIKRLLDLDDDEIIEVFRTGAAELPNQPREAPLTSAIEDTDAAIAASVAVTGSRLVAWRKRARQMTWPELRVLLLGLRTLELGPPPAKRLEK